MSRPHSDRRLKMFLSRQLRRDATSFERYAWSLLRNRQMHGLKFRRQHVIDGFVVDFYCPKLRLVIELDGSDHVSVDRVASYDVARTEWLTARARRVLRLRNQDLSREQLEELLRAYLT